MLLADSVFTDGYLIITAKGRACMVKLRVSLYEAYLFYF